MTELAETLPKSDSKISVIITAQSRRQFIVKAVESVLNQKNVSFPIELVIIKDFEDPDIDAFLDRNGALKVLCEGSLGEMLFQGVSKCTGDILCFLDDDDLFESGKLKMVSDLFLSCPDTAFLSHGQNVFISEETSTKIADKNEPIYSKYDTATLSPRNIIRLFDEGIDFNLSSICIKKTLVQNHNERLRNILGGPDTFLFLLAIESGSNVVRLSNRLTFYRIRTDINGEVSFSDHDITLWGRRSQFMLDMIGTFTKSENPVCNVVANYLSSDWAITRGLTRNYSSRLYFLKSAFRHLHYIRYGLSFYFLTKLFLAFMSMIHPRMAVSLYRVMKNRSIQRMMV